MMKNFINEVEGNPIGESKIIIWKNEEFLRFFSLKNLRKLFMIFSSLTTDLKSQIKENKQNILICINHTPGN